MKIDVFGEYGEVTVVGLTRTGIRICLMQLKALGEYAE